MSRATAYLREEYLMPEQQKQQFIATGTVVVSRVDLRSPRADAGTETIPAGTVGLVTGRSLEAWAAGDPHVRVNFGPYGVKYVDRDRVQVLNRPIAAPQGEPAPVYLWDVLVQLVQENLRLERELAALNNETGASNAHAGSGTGS